MLIRAANESDRADWDAFVATHPAGTPYHRWAWKHALEKSYGLKTHSLLARSDANEIQGVMPLARVARPFGTGPLCALPYCDRGEPLATKPEVQRTLIDRALKLHNSRLELRGTDHQRDSDSKETSELPELLSGQKVRMLLELPSSSDTLMSSFKSKHRSQINKAKKNGLTGSVSPDKDRVRKFYEVFTRNMRSLGSPTHSRRWFETVSDEFRSDCIFGLVQLDRKVVGAGLVLVTGDKATIPWASTLKEYNHLAPNMLLYWLMLEASIARGCRSFDFGRSSYGEGTYRFKRQWGAKPVPLSWQLVWPGDGVELRSTAASTATDSSQFGSTLRSFIEGIWRHLPLRLTIFLGSRLRPWVSL
ncbi:MAG: FemAB family PEP-CTERM system-associated protein [Congregibacter sp.]